MKTKKMTFNMVAAKIAEVETIQIPVYDGIIVDVKRSLGMKEALQFVQDIVSTCFDEEEATYIPEIFDAAVRIGTLMHYAGFDVPKEADKAFKVVYETELFDSILQVIDGRQFDELIAGAKRKIAFKRDLLTATAAQKVTELIAKMDEVMSKSVEVIDKVDTEELSNTIKEIAEKFNTPVDDVEGDDNLVMMPRRDGDGENER